MRQVIRIACTVLAFLVGGMLTLKAVRFFEWSNAFSAPLPIAVGMGFGVGMYILNFWKAKD